jgi:hypothetical protein
LGVGCGEWFLAALLSISSTERIDLNLKPAVFACVISSSKQALPTLPIPAVVSMPLLAHSLVPQTHHTHTFFFGLSLLTCRLGAPQGCLRSPLCVFSFLHLHIGCPLLLPVSQVS